MRKMFILEDRLMYSTIRGVELSEFVQFFDEKLIDSNSITYDEENEGFIIDIRRYTPLQMMYEYEFSKNEQRLSSVFDGPFLLTMEELDKEENIRVKRVILELFKRCLDYKDEQGLKRL